MNGRKQKSRVSVRKKTAAPVPVSAPACDLRQLRAAISQREAVVVAFLFVVAVAMRFAYPARIAIEHWDEAVYASNFFIPGGYPNLHLYAPPLLPMLIEWSMHLSGPSSLSAVLPNLVLGTLTVPLAWWIAREWFGIAAGFAAACLAALSDFHILYTRTALTDPALCFWLLLAVYWAWRALARNRLREAVIAGVATAAAWGTKYNGWLPLAIVLSAFVAWGLFERFNRREWLRRLPVVVAVTAVAALCWSPVWLTLPGGGYADVAKNHAGYFVGLAGWSDSWTRQAANFRYFDRWLSAGGLALSILLPATMRRRVGLMVVGVLAGLVALLTGATTLLLVPALLGPGFLLFVSYRRHVIEPAQRVRRLAAWLTAAWCIGLFVSTPAYTPYSRLVLPWLISAWLGTSALIGQVTDSWTAAEAASPNPRRLVQVRWLVLAVWLASPLATLRFHVGNAIAAMPQARASHFALFGNRFSMEGPSRSSLPVPGWQDRTQRGEDILRGAKTFVGRADRNPAVILTFGEPAIFFYLTLHNYAAQPLGSLDSLATIRPSASQPTFVMTYDPASPLENAALLALLHDTPSDLVLLDRYPPASLVTAQGKPAEELRIYSIKQR